MTGTGCLCWRAPAVGRRVGRRLAAELAAVMAVVLAVVFAVVLAFQGSLTACQPAALTAVALGEGSDVGGLVWDPSAAQLSTSYSHGPACVPAQPFPALPDSPLSAQQPTLRSHGCQQRVLLSGAQLHQPRLREKTKRWRALGDLVLR